MSDLVDLIVEDPRWDDLPLEALAHTAADLALGAQGLAADLFEISVMACDDARIAALNADFRDKPTPTNVLSWPAFELAPENPGDAPSRAITPDPMGRTGLGDIAIAYETVTKEAETRQISVNDHIVHLILHACLHLLGYDHQTEADATRMEALEVKALATMGIASPY